MTNMSCSASQNHRMPWLRYARTLNTCWATWPGSLILAGHSRPYIAAGRCCITAK